MSDALGPADPGVVHAIIHAMPTSLVVRPATQDDAEWIVSQVMQELLTGRRRLVAPNEAEMQG